MRPMRLIESHPALGTDVGAHIRGDFNYDFGSASYKWWFGHANVVFGAGLGAAYYKVRLAARGSVHAGEAGDSLSDSYHESAWAPMLTFGWRHAFNDQWRMYANVAGVKKNGGNPSGHIWNAALGSHGFRGSTSASCWNIPHRGCTCTRTTTKVPRGWT